ncbi:MAG: hypothetical protein CVU52_06200 [Deltaproteobacteria bacterium HGW-Deltaproteobacteria-10]|nr:MAG: hypothetical protein CVU52_06200 [Deltaproteobacteria bacterium HGW-Deltaproteobacteria-10]
MKRIFIPIFFFIALLIFSTSAYPLELYKCTDVEGNSILTSSPQDGMKDCVLKNSSDDSSPKEPVTRQKKSYKGRQEYQKEKAETEAKKSEEEQKEAALIREGNKCHTQALNVISGGSVSEVYYWRICKDKNGKIVSKRRL